jgi:hypothetical protein
MIDVLLIDGVRFLAMFALGIAVMLEIAGVRYAHIALWVPGSDVQIVPMRALLLLALSRILALLFISGVLHEHFGDELGWYAPVAAAVAIASLIATFIISRQRV